MEKILVELHAIQNFAPANLNRDDLGAPKECMFGGRQRARISSQCLKRAAREDFANIDLLPPEARAVRTRRLAIELAERLEAESKDPATAEQVVRFVLGGVRLRLDGKNLTEYLLFLGEMEIDRISALCLERWDDLVEAMESAGEAPGRGSRKRRASKEDMRRAVPADIRKATQRILDGGKSADVALFGRHVADMPDRDREAALQVAHAISTNQVTSEFDYFTALDDLQPDDAQGAGMIGTSDFNSSCFYRYSDVDVRVLQQNLQGDEELTLSSLEAYVRAFIRVVPSGNQSRTAVHSPPSFILAVVRNTGLWSLVNAFAMPVRPTWDKDIVTLSVEALDHYWGRLVAMYGEEDIVGKWAVYLGDEALNNLGDSVEISVEQLVANVMDSVRGGLQ